ncbi:EpsG family protein [Shivajiella indica]|uniref:EpsG family protein n=1 Tax=Shivajiella indica TaxID=872115 RepID=A0ABW5B8R4_9BACT
MDNIGQVSYASKLTKVNSSSRYLFFLFLINPFITFLLGIKNFRFKADRIFILLYGVFYGLTFIPIENSDATRYEERIATIGNYSFKEYSRDILGMYGSEARYNDAYVYTVYLIMGQFTSDPKLFRAFFAFIYFLVLIALIGNLYELSRFNYISKPVIWFLLGLVFLMNLSAGINGVRWPLALQVFLLGYVLYLRKGSFKYLLLAMSSFLIHFMAAFFIPFVLLFHLTKNVYRPIWILFLTAIVVASSVFILNSIQSNLGILGEGVEERSSGYVSNETFQEQRIEHMQNWNWYLRFDRYSTYYFGLIALAISVLFSKKINKDDISKQMEYFAFLIFIASFLSGTLVDPISNRFFLAANGTALIYLYYLSSINRNSRLLKVFKFIYIPIGILHILIMLRADILTFSSNLIIGNVFTEMIYRYL